MISFRLVSGRQIDLSNPTVDDVLVDDIACGLSKLCRFTGQLRSFYSVAEHAIMVSQLVDAPLRFAALHHDDSEAFLNDLSRNLKHSHYLDGYRELEGKWTAVIERALGVGFLTIAQRRQIKAADDLVAIFERSVLKNQYHWRPFEDIPQSLADGFVNNPAGVGELLSMSGRVPFEWYHRPFTTLEPAHAERLFLLKHAEYRAVIGDSRG